MNKYFFPVLFLLLLCVLSCTTTGKAVVPDPQSKPHTPDVAEEIQPTRSSDISLEEMNDDDVVVRFDTVTITKQTFISTKSEIERVVDDLNKITTERNYDRWLGYTSDEYREVFSSRDVLDLVSASLPVKGVRLRTLQDYFNYVFVPSRQNMRVDDIQFVTPTRVYVIMEITPSSPAAIYILEKTSQGWKLVPKNR